LRQGAVSDGAVAVGAAAALTRLMVAEGILDCRRHRSLRRKIIVADGKRDMSNWKRRRIGGRLQAAVRLRSSTAVWL